VVKFYLHVSKDYQKRRLQRRLDRPDKHWKFEPADLAERQRWDQYQAAFEEALSRCSTPQAPWYVVPGERRWYRDLIISSVLVELLESLDLRPPEPSFDPADVTIPD
jgi:polyphosphate kinase 2 (PPK2 family)